MTPTAATTITLLPGQRIVASMTNEVEIHG